MGDMKRTVEKKTSDRKDKSRLDKKIEDRQIRQQETVSRANNALEDAFGEEALKRQMLDKYRRPKVPMREKVISARVNGDIYEKFKEICKRQDITANACLNMLLSNYVQENKDYR